MMQMQSMVAVWPLGSNKEFASYQKKAMSMYLYSDMAFVFLLLLSPFYSCFPTFQTSLSLSNIALLNCIFAPLKPIWST